MARTGRRGPPVPMSWDREGWSAFYAERFCAHLRRGDEEAARSAEHLAIWYHLLYISENQPCITHTPATPTTTLP